MPTEEEKAEQQKTISDLVNSALTDQLKRKLPSIVSEAIKANLEGLKIDEQIGAAVAKLQQGQAPAAGAAGGAPAAGAGAAPAAGQPNPEMAAMSARLADMQKKLEEQTRQTAAEAAKARNEKRDSLLAETLGKINVDPNRRRGAAAVIREGAVWDEASSSWQYKARRDGYEETVPLEQYVTKEWAATDEGKSYISAAPPRGGAGTRQTSQTAMGTGGAARRMPADPKAAQQQARQDALTSLYDAAAGLVGGGSVGIGGQGTGTGE